MHPNSIKGIPMTHPENNQLLKPDFKLKSGFFCERPKKNTYQLIRMKKLKQ